jgi:GNAT superfamily N-acetyltransferase
VKWYRENVNAPKLLFLRYDKQGERTQEFIIDIDIPEIKDFGVFSKFQRNGIGTGLMDNIETVAATMSDTVCLGVGLHSGYGVAQRMYAKRGYIFDGTGAWDGAEVATPYAKVENGDDLVLYMSKKLK